MIMDYYYYYYHYYYYLLYIYYTHFVIGLWVKLAGK
jgi:hypothetical protein